MQFLYTNCNIKFIPNSQEYLEPYNTVVQFLIQSVLDSIKLKPEFIISKYQHNSMIIK